jgi:hypothetical protein
MRAPERVFQVQFVDAAHERQVGVADTSGQVVNRAPADGQQFGLARGGQGVITVDHRFALSNPALVCAPDKKCSSSACWPDLGVQGGQHNRPEADMTLRRISSRRGQPVCAGATVVPV